MIATAFDTLIIVTGLTISGIIITYTIDIIYICKKRHNKKKNTDTQ